METAASFDFLTGFWYIAIPVSVIFLIQTVMTFIGVDGTDGTSADFDADLDGGDSPFQLFSFRNLINFLLGFSWTGIGFYRIIENKVLLTLLAFAVGVLFLLMFYAIIRTILKLAEDNSFRIESTIDRIGEVYIPIPERKTGAGKISISVGGSMHELDAMTEGDRIPTSTKVKITRIEGTSLLIVETL
jgi:membrane protein implicated in regulation of membrane protease activity